MAQSRKNGRVAPDAAAVAALFALLELLDPGRQPRHLARRDVAVDGALAHPTHEFGLRHPQRLVGRVLIALGDRRLDLLEERADAALARAVDARSARGLAEPFLR